MSNVKIPSMLGSMSPTFQKAWYKKHKMPLPAHLQRPSQSGKVDTTRTKSLQAMSLKAYGATKGTKVGGEHGSSDEVRDTIAPLTRDQHSRVQAAARAAKAAEKPVAAKKTPLTKDQRFAAIAAAVRKAKAKHDVPTLDVNDDHDDLRDLHQSLHIKKGTYSEEVEAVDEALRVKDISVSNTLGSLKKPSPNANFIAKDRAQTSRNIAAGEVKDIRKQTAGNPEARKAALAKANYAVKQEEFESVDEAQKKLKPSYWRAEWRLGTQTEVDKNNKKIYDRLAKTDPEKAKAFHDNLMKMRKEENESKKQPSNYPGQKLQRDYLDRFKRTPQEDWKTKQDREYGLATGYKAGRWAHGGKYEEVEMNEVSKAEAEKVLGGPVKEKPKMPPGKQPAGYRYVRSLARKAMKGQVDAIHRSMEKTMKKEEIELIEQDDSMEKKEMAQTQLHFIKYAAEEILEFIDMGGEVEEWYQNKLSKVQSEVESLHSYIEGEKRRTGMVKEEEQIDEKAPPGREKQVKALKGKVDNPYAVAWASYNKKNEEVEQTDEAIRGYIQSRPGNEDGTAIRRPADKAERDQLARNLIANRKYNLGKKIGRKSGSVRSNAAGMTPSQKISTALRSPEASKELGPKKFPYMPKNAKITPFLSKEEVEQIDELKKSTLASYVNKAAHQVRAKSGIAASFETSGTRKRNPENKSAYMDVAKDFRQGAKKRLIGIEKATAKLSKEEVEQVTEAEGIVAVTPKEKALAAHHGDKTKITYGDVIKARIKSAAAKAMKAGK